MAHLKQKHIGDNSCKTRVEALEDTLDMLKDVIKLMRQDISELKKAQ